MSRQKKQIITAAVIVAVLAAVYGVLMLNPAPDKNEDNKTAQITDFDSDKINKISVVSKSGKEFAIEYSTKGSETKYKMTGGNEKGKYDENVMSQLRQSAADIRGTLADPSSKELKNYGLDDASLTDKITIESKGKTQTLIFGRKSKALKGRYCRLEDNSDVYFISSDTADTVTAPQEKYFLLQVLTSYYSLSADTKKMTVDTLSGTKFTVEKRDTSNLSKTEAMAYSDYIITQPERCSADDEALNSGIFSSLQDGLTAKSVVKANAERSDLSRYGLDKPRAKISLEFSNASADVLVGATEKDDIYVMTEGGNTIFACSAKDFEFLNKDKWTDYRSSKLLEFAITQMKSAKYTQNGENHTIKINHKSRDNDSDEITGTLDKKKIDSEHIQKLYSAAVNLNYLSQSTPVPAHEPEAKLKIVLTDGSQHEIKMIKGSSREYIADADGSGYIYNISKSDYDALSDVFKQ